MKWANDVLREGIKICQKTYSYKILGIRIAEIEYYIVILREFNFWWQARRLGNWLHRLMANHKDITVKKSLQPKADTLSQREREGS